MTTYRHYCIFTLYGKRGAITSKEFDDKIMGFNWVFENIATSEGMGNVQDYSFEEKRVPIDGCS